MRTTICRYEEHTGKMQLNHNYKPIAPKWKTSIEKKIERVWHNAEDHGWSYSDFVVHLLEVLVILQHRDKVKLAASKDKS